MHETLALTPIEAVHRIPPAYLFNGEMDLIIEFLLRVNSLLAVVLIALQEEVFKCGCILLLERHHHLITKPKQHQLRGKK